MRRSPEASASSTTARSRPSQPSLAMIGVPAGPVTRWRVTRESARAARSTSSVAVAAVGNRDLDGIGPGVPDTPRHCRGSRMRAERALERVRRTHRERVPAGW